MVHKPETEMCYCGSGRTYQQCCEPLHTYHQVAATAEMLMRSRYSAYYLGNIAYIQNTMRGKASIGFEPQAAEEWAKRVIWVGLQIVSSATHSDNEAEVEFIASFVDGKTLHRMHERSKFIRTQDQWFYVEGDSLPQALQLVSRNGVCPCGSQKKWKQCHGRR